MLLKLSLIVLFGGSPLFAQAPASPAAADPFDAAAAQLKNQDPAIRRRGAALLAQMGRPEGGPVLLQVLNDPNPYVRATAIDSLGVLRAAKASGPIAELLSKDKAENVRQSAAIALAYLADPASGDALIGALKDASPGVRYAAARTIGVLHVSSAAAALITALEDPDPAMRQSAAGALGQLHSKEGLAALNQGAAKETDPTIRSEMVRAVGNSNDPSSAKNLAAALKDPQPAVRIQAAQGLAKFGDLSGIPVACEILKDPNPQLRQQAAYCLGVIGEGKVGLAALNAALKAEKDPMTKTAIGSALVELKTRLGIKPETPKTAAKIGPKAPVAGAKKNALKKKGAAAPPPAKPAAPKVKTAASKTKPKLKPKSKLTPAPAVPNTPNP